MNEAAAHGARSLTAADFREELPRLHARAIEHRRHLHQYPELSGVEHQTTCYIEQQLRAMGVRILPFPGPGLVAQIDAERPLAPVIALRADIDALPVTEDDSKPVVSQHRGIAHACGHDGHTGILLAAAEWMAAHRDRLSASVRLIFQSSEEQIPSGAQRLVQSDVLADVEHIFGLHLWRDLPVGQVGIAEGAMMASTDDFDITLSGPGGHGGTPHKSVDVIVAAARLVLDFQTIVARQQDPLHPLVISVGHFQAEGNHNVMPAQALIRGTVRALDPVTQAAAQGWVTDAALVAADHSGATVDIDYQNGTPPLINDSAAAQYMAEAARRSCLSAAVTSLSPVMGGEDFSFYLEQVPGAFAFIGMGGPKSQHAHHTPKFDVDEDTLGTGIELMVGIVADYRSEQR